MDPVPLTPTLPRSGPKQGTVEPQKSKNRCCRNYGSGHQMLARYPRIQRDDATRQREQHIVKKQQQELVPQPSCCCSTIAVSTAAYNSGDDLQTRQAIHQSSVISSDGRQNSREARRATGIVVVDRQCTSQEASYEDQADAEYA